MCDQCATAEERKCHNKVLDYFDGNVHFPELKVEEVSYEMFAWLHSLCVEGKIKPEFYSSNIIVIDDGTTALAVKKG